MKIIYKLLIISFLILLNNCSKNEKISTIIKESDQELEMISSYREAMESFKKGDYYYASKKFSESESILPKIEFSAKASLMSSYCLYLINFYPESLANLERFVSQYPADKNVAYAHYLIAISL